MTNNNLTQTKWADHVRGCADLAKEIATRLDIRDDAARQAMLATMIISADRHNIFLEPIPEQIVAMGAGGLIAVPYGGKAEASASTVPAESPLHAPKTIALTASPIDTYTLPQRQEPPKGEVVGENVGAIRNPTPEQAEAASRGALLKGINSAREMLGFTPEKLNEYIQEKLKTHKTLGVLDVDELADLTERLSKRIDAEKKNERLAATNDALEDWP